MKILFLLAALFSLSVLFNFAAAAHWVFDLFRNFLVQYVLIALVFCALFLIFRQWAAAALMIAIAIACLISIRMAQPDSWTWFSPAPLEDGQPFLRVAQFNKYSRNKNYEEILAWARRTDRPFDVITLEESTLGDQPEWQKLKDIYTYQFPETNPLNDTYILSRHPLEAEYLHVQYGADTGKLVRFTVSKDGFPPVTFYALHTKVPFGTRAHTSRDEKLRATARAIAEDAAPYKIAIGDWNITPYSPAFQDFVRLSGLDYKYLGLWPRASWPSFLFIPALKIPIDQTMGSDNLLLMDQARDASMGSDHHALVSTYTVKP